MSGRIKVGHVELDDYWVYVDSQTPLAEKDLIRMAGMLPRDGTMVRCFRGDGSIAKGTISPGETVIVGSRPPPKGRISRPPPKGMIDPTLHQELLPAWLHVLSTVQNELVKKRGAKALSFESIQSSLHRAWALHNHKVKALRVGGCKTRLKNFWKTGRRECRYCFEIRSTDESLSESDKKALRSLPPNSNTRKAGFYWCPEIQTWKNGKKPLAENHR